MAPVFRTVTKRIFIIVNICVVILFLLACANRFLHPAKWWMISLLGLGFPFLLAANILYVLFWTVFRSKWAFLSLVSIIVGYSNIRALVGFHGQDFQVKKTTGAIRILSWNVMSFDEYARDVRLSTSHRVEMMNFINAYQPDILCFQEFMEPNYKRFYSNANDLVKLGYKYFFFVADYERKNKRFQIGVAIFSKFPISDSTRIQYGGPKKYRAAESLISADIEVDNQKIRVFTTHLQSVLLQKSDYRHVEIIKNAEDSMIEASRSLVKKLKLGYALRGDQVNTVRKELDESPYPEIICGDFNDVPNSYTYFRVRGDRRDAFVEKGRGLGRTFVNISPTLRIDYIMADRRFEVLQYKRFVLPYSDHYPVMCDLRLSTAKGI